MYYGERAAVCMRCGCCLIVIFVWCIPLMREMDGFQVKQCIIHALTHRILSIADTCMFIPSHHAIIVIYKLMEHIYYMMHNRVMFLRKVLN